jgi:hypothetical protein
MAGRFGHFTALAAGLALCLAIATGACGQAPAGLAKTWRCGVEPEPAPSDLFLDLDEAQSTVAWRPVDPTAPAAERLPRPDPGSHPAAIGPRGATISFVVGGRAVGVFTLAPPRSGDLTLWTDPDPGHPFWSLPTRTPDERRAQALAGRAMSWSMTWAGKPGRLFGVRCTRYPPPPPKASARVIDGSAHFRPNGFQPLKITLDMTPEQLAKILPVRDGRFEVAMFHCEGVAEDGRLMGCVSAGAYPDGARYSPGEALAKRLFVSREEAAQLKGRAISGILAAIQVEHTSEPAEQGPCYHTVCSAVIPPPPPPK